MVGRWRPASRGDVNGPPLLAGLPLRQQAKPYSVHLAPTAGRGGAGGAGRGGPKGDTIFQGRGFSRVKVARKSLRGLAPLLYEAHRRNIASI
ncbi:hypothetical protein SAMN05444159_3855 [Bradyrhizobium lablabi]|uniref:Uncharacterized protein n=1 Tax=Bradyrhizobium lablabi TaxID=722472 RepID=A0A1M6UBF1_9BRAD|nr:hypothetical protein SAMN05444159_3855 [Bradyrhizobium lablabi]